MREGTEKWAPVVEVEEWMDSMLCTAAPPFISPSHTPNHHNQMQLATNVAAGQGLERECGLLRRLEARGAGGGGLERCLGVGRDGLTTVEVLTPYLEDDVQLDRCVGVIGVVGWGLGAVAMWDWLERVGVWGWWWWMGGVVGGVCGVICAVAVWMVFLWKRV